MPCTHCHVSSFVLELKPTGEVRQYSASATYELQRESEALVDTLKLVAQAEGKYPDNSSISFIASIVLCLRTRPPMKNIVN